MSAEYPIIDLASATMTEPEPMGGNELKRWFAIGEESHAEGEHLVLFKPVTFHEQAGQLVQKGDDWSEKIAAEVAAVLCIPAARVDLAVLHDEIGLISYKISGPFDNLEAGNTFLYQYDRSYALKKKHQHALYTVDRIFETLEAREVLGPTTELDARSGFACYLALDALIGNTDRHHENWAVVWGPDSPKRRLAQSFDHASSMGFQLNEQQRRERVETSDPAYTVEAYAAKASSRPFAGRPNLVSLAVEAFSRLDSRRSADFCRSLSDELPDEAIEDIVDRVPDGRMSHPTRIFVKRLLKTNRRRLLDELNSYAGG